MHKKMKLAFIAALVLLAIAFCAYIVLPDDYVYKEKISNHVYDTISLIIVITVFIAYKVTAPESRDRKRWLFLLIGMIGWFLGDVTWTIMIYMGIDPLPSPADIFYIIGYVAVLVAVIIKYLNIKNRADRRDYTNSIFVTACILAVISYFVLHPIAASDYDLLNKVILIFYPVIDTIILLFAVIVISASDFDTKSMPWLGIGIGITLWVIADTMTAYFEWSEVESVFNSMTDVIFVAGLLAIGIGAVYRKIIADEHLVTNPPARQPKPEVAAA